MVSDRDKDSPALGVLRGIRAAGPLLTAGIQLAAAAGVVGFIGYELDHLWNTTPWLMVAGIFSGTAAGMYFFIKTVNEVNRNEQGNNQKKQ